uniref:Uncharacterized protein n=1 Tax=Anguilla anguilla TaxID=7936 RepID=A0A0E9TQB1_ANGAN
MCCILILWSLPEFCISRLAGRMCSD